MNSLSLFMTIIWHKLANRKIQIYSMLCIFLYIISSSLYWYFGENGNISFSEISLNFFIFILLGAIVSVVILFFTQNIKQNKNDFINQTKILNTENFIKIYIIYYAITIPIGLLLKI
jgi:hypothetical protein